MEKPVTSLTVANNVALVTLDHIPSQTRVISDIFKSLADIGINVDMISQTPPYGGAVKLSFSIPSGDLVTAIGALNCLKDKIPHLRIDVDSNNTKLSIFGEGMRNNPGIAARLFKVLADNDVEIKLITTSEVDISCLIYEKDEDRSIEAIRKEFQLD